MNLFWSTRRLTQSREDHLTEFFAAALNVDIAFREAYGDLLLMRYARQKGWAEPKIKEASTQLEFPDKGCRFDLILTLGDGRQIACEHKIESPETLGKDPDDETRIQQLERYLYLELPVEGLAYVRASWKAPSERVLSHQKYIRPVNREHFLWRDFYPALLRGTHELTAWIREGFERLGYTPPHPVVGDLNDPDSKVREQNRRNFAKLWDSTRSFARGLKWKVQRGSICELYLERKPNAPVVQVYLSPMANNGDILRFRVTPRDKKVSLQLELQFCDIARGSPFPIEIERHEVARTGGQRVEVIDTHAPLRKVLGDATGTDKIEERLLRYVSPFFEVVS